MISEFQARLVYRVTRTTRVTQRNPISKTQNNNNKQKLGKNTKIFYSSPKMKSVKRAASSAHDPLAYSAMEDADSIGSDTATLIL